MRSAFTALTLLSLALPAPALRAEEGMWTFDNVPAAAMKAKYGFAPDAAWLHRVQLSTLRFPGGTGAFVSKDGLVLTNHHVGRSAIQQVGTKDQDFILSGFRAADRSQELKVPGLELMMLVSTRNVTAEMEAAERGLGEAQAAKARRAALSALVKAEQDRTGLTCQPVTLYQGGESWIYAYRKFTDVRLVAAPELQVAAFGGDPDNFTYPRHNLDFSLFRVYVDGQPYHPEAYLPWATAPLHNGDLTLVVGHPGTTFRQQTQAQMVFARDIAIPAQMAQLARRRQALEAFAAKGDEPKRISADLIYFIDNGLKTLQGRLDGLRRPEILAKAAAAEAELRAKVEADPALKASAGASWDRIAQVVERQKALLPEAILIPARDALGSDLLHKALTLVRMPAQAALPADKRLPEFAEGALKATRERLLNPAPAHLDLERARLAWGLQEALLKLGADHPAVKALLAGKSPEAAAKAALEGTRMGDPAFRTELLEGGQAALDASRDPLVALARVLDPFGRAAQQRLLDEVQGPLEEQGGRIAQARFRIYGKSLYPDATFTLRISYGPVATYHANGTLIQPFTTFHGLFDRAIGWGPEAEHGAWSLPRRWWDSLGRLDLATPFNFVYACDTVGGNSGSPVVNARGELVGLNFDSNIEAQAGYYVYDGATKRSIAVDARAIREALVKVMDGAWIAQELSGK